MVSPCSFHRYNSISPGVVQPGPKYFCVEFGSFQETVSVDHHKPHLGSAPLLSGVPVHRGRAPHQLLPSSSSAELCSVQSSLAGLCDGLVICYV
jgi:hypothetical protein